MTRLYLGISISVLSSAGPLWGQIPDSAFRPTGGYSSQVLFLQSPVPLAWSAIAQAARPDFQAAHPDTNLIRDSYEERLEVSLISFEAPLPPSLPRRHYWVLADSGATEVHPQKVIGTITIGTDTASWAVTQLSYNGYLEAPRPAGEPLGASSFGVFSPSPIRIRSTPASIAGTKVRPTVRAALGSRQIEVRVDSGRGAPSRARVFKILETGQAFLSVRWPDGDICAGDYLLYDISAAVARFLVENPGECSD